MSGRAANNVQYSIYQTWRSLGLQGCVALKRAHFLDMASLMKCPCQIEPDTQARGFKSKPYER